MHSNVQWIQLRIEDHLGFRTFGTKFGNILTYGMNLKFEAIVQIFRKSTFLKTLTNNIEKLSKKVATKWTFILLWR